MLKLALLFLAATHAYADRYANYAELAAHNREGRDYCVVALDRSSPVAVYSVHGGNIERGTSELADAIAGTDLNRYDFRGLLGGRRSLRLHVTSHHFDEPRALDIAARSNTCISVHGYNPRPARQNICLGGLDAGLRGRIRDALAPLAASSGFSVEEPCVKYEGSDPLNIVNRCAQTGVQLEISWQLYQRLERNPALRQSIADGVRSALDLGTDVVAAISTEPVATVIDNPF